MIEPDHSGRLHVVLTDNTKTHLRNCLAVTKWNASGVIRFSLSVLNRILSGSYDCRRDGCMIAEILNIVNVSHVAAGEQPPFPAQPTQQVEPATRVGHIARRVAATTTRSTERKKRQPTKRTK